MLSFRARAVSGDLDPMIAVENSAGNILMRNDDYDAPNSRDALLEGVTLSDTGTYTVKIVTPDDGAILNEDGINMLMRYYPGAFQRPSCFFKLASGFVASASAIVGNAFPRQDSWNNNSVFRFFDLGFGVKLHLNAS